MTVSSTNHISTLDGLRGLAVVLVFLRHFAYLGNINCLNSWSALLGNLVSNGSIGVALFFVLSGFLIARPFFSGTQVNLKAYFTRRVLRIVPAYYVVLFLAVFGLFPLFSISQDQLGWRVFYHLFFLQDYLPSDIVTVFWTLGVEQKFYMLAPLCFALVLRLKQESWQVAAIIVACFFGILARTLSWKIHGPIINIQEFLNVYRFPFHDNLDGLFGGVLLARLEHLKMKVVTARCLFWLGAGAILFILLFTPLQDSFGLLATIVLPFFISLVMVLLVAGAVFGGAPRFLSMSLPRWLGRISYSLYLLHLPLKPLALNISILLLGQPVAGALGVSLYFCVFALISLVCANLLYQTVEKPFLTFRMRFD